MSSLSDSEIMDRSSKPKLTDIIPKHKLSYLDHDEPKSVSPKPKPKSKRGKDIDMGKNILFQFKMDMGKFKSIDDDEDEDEDSDSTWFPPQHPKSKLKKLKTSKKSKKPKEERWSFWKKQLPEDVDYCEEEIEYFMKQSMEERKKFMEEEKKLSEQTFNKSPPRFRFLNAKYIADSVRLSIIQRIDSWYSMDPTQNEYIKLGNWVRELEKLPFDRIAPSIPELLAKDKISIGEYLMNAKKTMDGAVFGHEEAKEQILELLAKEYTNPDSKHGFCIGIQGPAGNGKTTLIKDGICKAIGRPFQLIGLGGAKNSDSLLGHDYTYEGGTYGRIVHALQLSKVMNPVIYFDELDKISEDTKGDEISNLLCHITDPSQNQLFEDKYFSGIPIDLSRVIFIFSFNDESKINPILRDRIHIIRTEGLSEKQKCKIVNDYVLPEVYRDIPSLKLTWSNSMIEHVIKNYTGKEKGVRNLRRAIFTICRKINLHSIIKTTDLKLYTKPDISSGDSIVITKKIIDELLKTEVKKSIPNFYI